MVYLVYLNLILLLILKRQEITYAIKKYSMLCVAVDRVSEPACFGTAPALAPGIFNPDPAPAPGNREQKFGFF